MPEDRDETYGPRPRFTQDDIDRAFLSLSRDEQQVFVLYRIDGLSHAQIGDRLGISATQARHIMADAMFHSLRALRRIERQRRRRSRWKALGARLRMWLGSRDHA